jgi:hypothetical protein
MAKATKAAKKKVVARKKPIAKIKAPRKGAPKGNQFWKLRSKHGRDKIFQTPNIMLEACYEYFEFQSQQSWDRVDYKGRDLKKVEIPVSSPFTLTGLCIFLGVNSDYFSDFADNLNLATEEGKDFSRVIKHVKEVIYTQKLEGAAVGTYNANIIARDLGLKDERKTEHSGEIKTNTPKAVKLPEGETVDTLKQELQDLIDGKH